MTKQRERVDETVISGLQSVNHAASLRRVQQNGAIEPFDVVAKKYHRRISQELKELVKGLPDAYRLHRVAMVIHLIAPARDARDVLCFLLYRDAGQDETTERVVFAAPSCYLRDVTVSA